jgi:inhibitor of the pro-sigma K processing machinery
MVIKLDFSNALVILGCIIVLWIIGKIFSVPLKALFKLIINSVLGGLLIFIINLIGAVWNFHIGLNIVTAILVGILGIPGAVLLVILKLFI